MDKLKMHTPNLTDDNFAALAALFPNAVTETIDENGIVVRAIDADVLSQEINTRVVSGKEERYQFTWPDKRKSVLLANAPIAAALRPCREESVDFDTTENLYIDGDNLDVLKLLRETYLNRVKMIYIDPPYNTSNDFIYNDDFSEDIDLFLSRDGQYDDQGNRLVKNPDRNGRFHTDWLNMIYPRLRVARDLLTDDGVIFISIDDNEVENLKKICNEVFGEQNAIGTVIQNKQNAKNDTTDLQKNHEFILVYRKMTRYDGGTKILPTIIRRMQKPRDIFEENGDYFYINDPITTRGEGGILSARPNLGYTVYFNPTTGEKTAVCDYDVSKAKTAIEYEDLYTTRDDLISQGYVAIRPPRVRGQLGVWTWALEKFNDEKRNIIITGKSGAYSVKKRTFVPKENVSMIDGKMQYVEFEDANARSIWDYSTNNGTVALNNVMKAPNIFDNAKNLEMLTECVRLVPDDDFIILDFFSGSATTANAVMQLNAEDGGKRKFIMVQIPEPCPEGSEALKAGYKTICEIGKERIRRAGEKIKEEAGLTSQGLDIGFRVLKLDSSNMKDVYYTPEEYAQMHFALDGFTDNIKPDRTDEDLLFQVMLDLGIPLSARIEQDGKIFTVDGNYLIACFGEVDMALITEIAKKQPYYVVFRDSSFINDSALVNFEQVFNTYSPKTIRKVL